MKLINGCSVDIDVIPVAENGGDITGERCDIAITGERPLRAALQYDGYRTARAGRIDRAGIHTAAAERHRQRRDAVHDDGAIHGLIRRSKGTGAAVGAGGAPAPGAIVALHTQQCIVGRSQRNAAEGDDAGGICHIEHIAVFGNQAAAGHGEGSLAHFCVSRHALIDHHVVDVFLVVFSIGS